MLHCTKCGTQFEGRFCPNCGEPAEPNAAAGAPVPPPVSIPAVTGIPANIACLLCYVVPVAGPLFFLLVPPYNRDGKVRFDAWQALFLDLAYFAVEIILGFLSGISGQGVYYFSRLLHLAFVVIVVYMAIKVYQNERVMLPYIGPLAEKQK
jgi:uncharacterized membrane protein